MPAEASRALRELAGELARLRSAAGLSLRGIGERGGAKPAVIPHARVKRIEAGEALPSREQAEHWLAATQADEATRVRVLDLVDAVHSQHQSWSALLDATPDGHLQSIAAAREEEAWRIDVYTQQWLPGLVQSRTYMRGLLAVLGADGMVDNVDEAVGRRLDRQQIVGRGKHAFRFLLTRRALSWLPVGGDADEQASHLRSVGELPAVQVRVLEDDAEPIGGWSSFTIYDSPTPMVSIELEHRALQVFDDADVERYRRRFRELWDASVDLQP